jgi:hypothetical protein
MTTNKGNNKKLIILAVIFLTALIILFLYKPKSPGIKNPGTLLLENSDLHFMYTVFEANGGWGYEISVNSERFIYQEFIPGVSGNQPFLNEDDANACAGLVIEKLKQRKIPSVSKWELDSLSISHLP